MKTSIHPFYLAMAMLGATTSLYAVYQHNPLAAPAILAASLAALAARAAYLRRESAASPGGGIDFDALRRTQVLSCGDWIKMNLRGHDDEVDLVLRKIHQRAALAGPTDTLGDFLLAGPTGTGKTFLAELVAKALYPKSEPVILRMNQYKDAQDVFTLLGPPAGQPG